MATNASDLTQREQVNLLLAVMYDFASHYEPGLLDFLDHIGFDLRAVTHAREIVDALPAFYRTKRGCYDVNRLERDVISWEPIARAIVEAVQKERRTKSRTDVGV